MIIGCGIKNKYSFFRVQYTSINSMTFLTFDIPTKIIIFILSLLFHSCLFSLVYKGFLGNNNKRRFIFILNNINKSSLIYLFIIIIIFISYKIYLYQNTIFLDVNEIHMKLDNYSVTLKGQMVIDLINQLGPYGAFYAGARISATLLAHNKMAFWPKIGTCGLGGGGLALTYKIITTAFPPKINPGATVSEVGPTHIEATVSGNLSDFIKYAKEFSQMKSNTIAQNLNSHIEMKPTFIINNSPINSKFLLDPLQWKGTLSVTKEVQKVQVDWTQPSPMNKPEFKSSLDSFIKCPLEYNEDKFFSGILTDLISLEFIKIYLLLILLIISACKLLIKSDSLKFEFLNKYSLGRHLNSFLNKYIIFWQKSSNFWVFFIIILLLIFSLTTFTTLIKLKQLF
uniref:hypothetical protein 29 n=1 Tax=Moniliophthora perniciosa TaxID=153609 RepID=UPI0000242376|nr:hypothetical protein 29 [Moniliophthora perniciosa]AAQ74319.1 hypothetical protein 29 [Moniliophthora perniciosa]